MAKQRVKAGTSKAEARKRRALFVEAMAENGGNATQAAITAGYSRKTAKQQGSRLLSDVNVAKAIEERRAEALADAQEETGVSIKRTLQELARIAYFDPASLFGTDGKLLAVRDMPEGTRAALAKIKIKRLAGGMKVDLSGEGAALEHVPEEMVELSIWDKNSAIEKAMKHLGLFERDNEQKPPAVLMPGVRTAKFEPFKGRKAAASR